MLPNQSPDVTWWLALITAYTAANTTDPFVLDGLGCIRTADLDKRCPICAALYWVSDGKVSYYQAAHSASAKAALKYTPGADGAVSTIVKAADYPSHASPLRRALLRACGLGA